MTGPFTCRGVEDRSLVTTTGVRLLNWLFRLVIYGRLEPLETWRHAREKISLNTCEIEHITWRTETYVPATRSRRSPKDQHHVLTKKRNYLLYFIIKLLILHLNNFTNSITIKRNCISERFESGECIESQSIHLDSHLRLFDRRLRTSSLELPKRDRM